MAAVKVVVRLVQIVEVTVRYEKWSLGGIVQGCIAAPLIAAAAVVCVNVV
jgi:hypothetical protein